MRQLCCLTFSDMQKTDFLRSPFFVSALPIFPARLQASIFGAGELNCRVRNGNGWTLTAISTDLLSFEKESKQRKLQRIFLSLPSFSTVSTLFSCFSLHFLSLSEKENGDPCGNRTHVCGVRGRRLSRLTNGPYGAPSRIRTGDPLIKSQLLYQLS